MHLKLAAIRESKKGLNLKGARSRINDDDFEEGKE